GTPLLIHQPSYSMLNRWIEHGLLDTLDAEGVGCIVFSPLAQGVLTGKYLAGVPAGSRASEDGSLTRDQLSEENMARGSGLNDSAPAGGRRLARMARSWVLRAPRVTSARIGASSAAQLEENLAATRQPGFSESELAAIDRYATEGHLNIWAASSEVPSA